MTLDCTPRDARSRAGAVASRLGYRGDSVARAPCRKGQAIDPQRSRISGSRSCVGSRPRISLPGLGLKAEQPLRLEFVARVYVSSTAGDLEEQRKAVSAALRRLGHMDVAMEYYVAEENPPLDRCLADVRSCDAYIGVFAWRYGSIPEADNPNGLSFTELEYRCAMQSGKPCLVFLLSEDADWPRRKMDTDLRRVEDLRQALKSGGHIVNTFETTDELAREVTEAVVAWEKRSGLVGEREPADWQAYRAAVLSRHVWVRLQVIAGASRERDPVRIPLTDVFEPQLVIGGVSGTDVPDEVRQYQQEIYGARITEPDDGAVAPGDVPEGQDSGEEGDGQLFAGSPEQVLNVLGRERTQVFLGGPGSGKSTLLQYAMLRVCEIAPAPERGPQAPDGRAGTVPCRAAHVCTAEGLQLRQLHRAKVERILRGRGGRRQCHKGPWAGEEGDRLLRRPGRGVRP